MYMYIVQVSLETDEASFNKYNLQPCKVKLKSFYIISEKKVSNNNELLLNLNVDRGAKYRYKMHNIRCIECNMQYNEYLPEKFFHLLHYIREAINIYAGEYDIQDVNAILDKFNIYNFDYSSSPYSSCPDAEYILAKSQSYDKSIVYKYYNKIIQEIIDTLSIKAIRIYDKIGSIYDIENRYHSLTTPKDILLNKIQHGMHVVFEVLRGFSKGNVNIKHIKYRFINDLKASSLEDSLLCLKRSIILNHKYENLYREEIQVSLSGKSDDIIGDIDDENRTEIIDKINKGYDKYDTVKKMLDKFNSYYHIMNNSKFKKKELAKCIYIMYCSEYIKKDITFKEFRDLVCMYYEKPLISYKQNDIIDEARVTAELLALSPEFSKFKIRLKYRGN